MLLQYLRKREHKKQHAAYPGEVCLLPFRRKNPGSAPQLYRKKADKKISQRGKPEVHLQKPGAQTTEKSVHRHCERKKNRFRNRHRGGMIFIRHDRIIIDAENKIQLGKRNLYAFTDEFILLNIFSDGIFRQLKGAHQKQGEKAQRCGVLLHHDSIQRPPRQKRQKQHAAADSADAECCNISDFYLFCPACHAR